MVRWVLHPKKVRRRWLLGKLLGAKAREAN